MKVILIVMDSVGIGAAPDAADYGDTGSATLQHTGRAAGGLNLPALQQLGLGNIHAEQPIPGCPTIKNPTASYGMMQETSQGKDTVTGHWELCGLKINPGFHNFPLAYPSFPRELLTALENETGRAVIGNKAASGTAIIDELGEEHMQTGAWIAYTSADSVMQLAAHTDIIPLDELYRAAAESPGASATRSRSAASLHAPLLVSPAHSPRTEDRRDFAYTPEEPLLTERLTDAGIPVYAVGKIEDILAHRGITESIHSGNTEGVSKNG